MRLTGKHLAPLVLLMLFASAPAMGQGGYGSNPYYDYNGSSLMQNGGQQNIYYPYWHNYLDNMQQEGGYEAVQGSYPNSRSVTSYYPSAENSQATTPQAAQPNMYYNYNDYYRSAGQPQYQGAQNPAANYGGYGAARAAAGQPAPGAANAPNQPLRASAQPTPQNRGPVEEPTPTPQEIAAEQEAFLRLSGRTAQQNAISAAMTQAQAQARAQSQAYGGNQGATNAPPAGYAAGQEAYMNGSASGPGAGDLAYSADPRVRRAQEEARQRAEARRKAAEQAAQQQAAMQELQQAQQLYEQAQSRLQQEEQKQKALQAQFHRRAVEDAYDSLRQAQQRYYDLMGVEAESAAPAPSYQQPNPMAVTTNPSYNQPGAAPTQPQAAAAPAPQQPQVMPQRPTQATPLYAQNSGQSGQGASREGGLWSTIKSIFAPPAGVNQRALFDQQRRQRDTAY